MAYTTTLVVPSLSVPGMVIYCYGSLDLTGQFLTDNSFIPGIDADMSAYAGEYVSYDPALSGSTPAPLSFSRPASQVTTGAVIGQPTQSVYNLCVQAYGTLNLLGKFLTDNGIDGVEDTDIDRSLTYALALVQSTQVNVYNANNNIVYATLWQA